MNNAILRNKQLYKIFISIIRYTPMTIAACHIISLIFNYFGIKLIFLAALGGTSILFIGILYLISYIFNFCYLYRIPLYYSTVMVIFYVIRSFGLLPIDLEILYRVYAIIAGFFISLFVYYKYKNRNNKNIDHIKELCKRYGCCS